MLRSSHLSHLTILPCYPTLCLSLYTTLPYPTLLSHPITDVMQQSLILPHYPTLLSHPPFSMWFAIPVIPPHYPTQFSPLILLQYPTPLSHPSIPPCNWRCVLLLSYPAALSLSLYPPIFNRSSTCHVCTPTLLLVRLCFFSKMSE